MPVTLHHEQRNSAVIAASCVAEDNFLCIEVYLPNKMLLLEDVSLCFASAIYFFIDCIDKFRG